MIASSVPGCPLDDPHILLLLIPRQRWSLVPIIIDISRESDLGGTPSGCMMCSTSMSVEFVAVHRF